MRTSRLWVLAVILVAGGATAFHLSMLLRDRADSMTRYVRVDSWAVQKVEFELQQFKAILARHVLGESDSDIESVRVQLGRAGSAVRTLARDPGHDSAAQMVDIQDAAQATLGALDEIARSLAIERGHRQDLAFWGQVEALLSDPLRRLRQSAIDLAHVRAELQNADLGNMRWLSGISHWMLIGFLGVIVVFIMLLISEIRAAKAAEKKAVANEQRSSYLAEHDLLTGLPNRIVFRRRLGESLAHAQQTGGEIVLHVLDLDNFKHINDSFGHGIGDELLISAALRLEEVLAGSVPLFRLDGDEFAVIETCRRDSAKWGQTARAMIEAFAAPFQVEGRVIHTSTSIGLARFPEDDTDVGGLLKAADLALHAAKQARGCFVPFDQSMLENAQDRKQLEEELRQALAQNEIEVFLQPQIDLSDGRCIGAEALVRWNHRTHGWISPGRFIPVAEESGLILPLGRMVLETACREALTWQDDGRSVVAVNLSPSQFAYQDVVAEVQEVLALTGLPPARLELEITEGMVMRDQKAAIEILERLHELGVQLALDDFGTGYSSLSYLKTFKVDKLKIDQSFVREIEHDRDDRMITSAIVEMAKGLGMRTIAEGIETEAQQSLLHQIGCEEGQGYHFGRPMPATEFQRLFFAGPVSCRTDGDSRSIQAAPRAQVSVG